MSQQTLEELEKQLEECDKLQTKDEQEKAFHEVLKNYTGDDEIISFDDALKYHKGLSIKSFSSGLADLDEILSGGFHEGDLIVITAETGQGKTTLLQTITSNLSDNGIKSLWFTYEVPIQQLLLKFGNTLPLGYTPKVLTEKNITWIERKIVEAIVKYNVKAVFIDPFNSLADFSTPNLSQELGDLAEQLKAIAIKYNIILFTAAHTNTVQEIITINNLRDTRLLGNKADLVLALWRLQEKKKKFEVKETGIIWKNESKIQILKNRFNGRLNSFNITMENNKFLTRIHD